MLSGPLPPEFGELSLMRTLNLGRNKISGPIPLQWSGMGSMVNLILDHNRIDGVIPDLVWHDMPMLAKLDLSFNKM